MKKTLFSAILALGFAGSASALSWDFTPTIDSTTVPGEDIANMTITLGFDTAKLTTAIENNKGEAILTAGHMGSEGWGIGVNADGQLCAWLDGAAGTKYSSKDFATLATNYSKDGTTVLIVSTGTTNITGYLPGTTVYMNGTGSYALSKGTYTTDEIDTITLNDAYADALTYSSLSNTTMNGSQAYNKSEAVYAIPEPTTATLSLLALAGLAARRRRK